MQSCSSCKTVIFLPLLLKGLLYGTDLSSALVSASSLIELESLLGHSLRGSGRKYFGALGVLYLSLRAPVPVILT